MKKQKNIFHSIVLTILVTSLVFLFSDCNFLTSPKQGEKSVLLHFDPEHITLNAGGTGEVLVTVERTSQFTGAVTLCLPNAQYWGDLYFYPKTVQSVYSTSRCVLEVEPDADPGNYKILVDVDIDESCENLKLGEATLSLTVIPAQQDFSLSLTQDPISIEQGKSSWVDVIIDKPAGFNKPITFSLEGAPAGVTPVFDPNPTTGSSSRLTLSVDTSVTPANYNLTIKGISTLFYTSEDSVSLTLIVTEPTITAVWEIKTQGVLPHLYGLHFIDDNLGWVVGDHGAIYKITNSGNSFTLQNSKTDQILNDVHFTDASTGVAVGEGRTIRRTTNGGATWDTLSSPAMMGINGVFFINENRGWVVSTLRIYRTTDAGENWETQYETGGFDSFNSVYFTSADFGIVVGYQNFGGGILRTTDGGTTWDIQTSGTTSELTDVYFIDANTGIAVGFNGTILRTTDGGINWDTQTSGTSLHLKGVAFTDADNGWAVGGEGGVGVILHTTNGGTDWGVDHLYNIPYNLEKIFFVDSNIGFVVGWGGVILRRSE